MVGDGSFRVSGADGDVWFCFFFGIVLNTEEEFPIRLDAQSNISSFMCKYWSFIQ
jgi:hypothetical protein